MEKKFDRKAAKKPKIKKPKENYSFLFTVGITVGPQSRISQSLNGVWD